MKKVAFQKLTITNFKGIKSLEVIFSKNTIIKGDNGTGKSTVFDAMLWCLFGKNSQNDQKFSIKNTVDADLNRQDHIVELLFVVDDQRFTAKRLYKETWTKRRGSEETEFTGHETLYFWNNVPCSQKEYQIKVSEVVEEQLFKLLTNPLYFNLTLKETERRDTLVKMAGEIPNEKIINGTPMYQELFAKIKGLKSLDEYKKEVSYERLALKKQLSEIPARIDELFRNTPKAEDWKDLENEINQKQKAIKAIDDEIEGLTSGITEHNKAIQKVQTAIFEAERQMRIIANKLKGDAENEANKKNLDIRQAQRELEPISEHIKTNKSRLADYAKEVEEAQTRVANLRKEWQDENAKVFTFDQSLGICPTCKRELESSDIEKTMQDLESAFNQAKEIKLSSISTQGASTNKYISQVVDSINTLGSQTSELLTKQEQLLEISFRPLAQPEPIDLNIPEYLEQKAIAEQSLPEFKTVDVSDQKDMKQALQEGIDSLRAILSTRETIAKNTARIEELKAEEKKYSKDLADLEKTEFTIDSFQKAKMDFVEKSINDKFKIVRFKLFRSLVNGGEEQCCETVVGGVPFSDLNHAGQIQSGIDISNALSQFYGVSAPIIVDNAEALTSFLETDSQLIRLYVTLDKELTIVNE